MSSDSAYPRVPLPNVQPANLERLLWIVVGLSLVGDIVTTFVGLHLGLAESNPLVRSVIEGYGLVGMIALKAVAIGAGAICRPLLTVEYRPIVPAGLALPWLVAIAANLYMISTVV